MIVTVLGGSACSTPVLVDWLAKNHSASPITIRLAGRTERKLNAVARACRLLAGDAPLRVERFSAGEWVQALSGADVVLIQVRIGDLQARQFDEAFPPPHGIPGDEGLGPGGLSAAVRTWPELRHLLGSIAVRAPSSLPLLLTSPAGLLIQCAAREFPDLPLAAICELPFTTLASVCAASDISVDEASFSYAGVNHLGWLYDITHDGSDLLGKYAEQLGPSFRQLVRSHKALPLKYWRLHFERENVAAEQHRGGISKCRSTQLIRLQESMLMAFEEKGARCIRDILSARPAEWYTEALGPLLSQIAGNKDSRPYFISRAKQNRPVYERACRLVGRQFVPLPNTEAPASVRGLIDRFAEYEALAAESVYEPDPQSLKRALLAHPWLNKPGVTNSAIAASLASEIWHCFKVSTVNSERYHVACQI